MAQLICKNCGAPLRPGAKFCIKCGTKIILEGQDQPVSQVEQTNGAVENRVEAQPVQEVRPIPQQPPQPKKVDLEYVNSRKKTAKVFKTIATIFAIISAVVGGAFIAIAGVSFANYLLEYFEIQITALISIILAFVGLIFFLLMLLVGRKSIPFFIVSSFITSVLIAASGFLFAEPQQFLAVIPAMMVLASIPMNILFGSFSKAYENAKVEYEIYKKFEEEQKAKEEKLEEEPPIEEQKVDEHQ